MKKVYLFLLGLFAVHLFLLTHLKFTAWPEIFSFPYLYNNGLSLYKDFVHVYTPFLTLILANVYKVFGYNIFALKTFTWLLILVADWLVFLITKKITKKDSAALLGVCLYVLTQPFLEGNMLWFDTALTVPVLAAVYFLITNKNSFWVGLALSVAFMTKQTSLVYIFVATLFYILSKDKLRKLFNFFVPVIITGFAFLLTLHLKGSLQDFYNWNFYYPANFWTSYPTYVDLILSKKELLLSAAILLPGISFLIVNFKETFKNKDILLLSIFLLAAVIAIYPRFSLYHLQPAIALAAVINSIVLFNGSLSKLFGFMYIILVLMIIAIPSIKNDWNKETRFWSPSEFNLGNKIVAVTAPNEKIFLLGIHSALYILSAKIPPSPWLDNYGWYYEIPGNQELVINSWKNDPPGKIFIQDANIGEWYEVGVYQPKQIMEYISQNYTKIEELEKGIWRWDLKK